MATATKSTEQPPATKAAIRQPDPLPAQNSNFYHFAETLSTNKLAIIKSVCAFMKTKVAPTIYKRWAAPRRSGTRRRRLIGLLHSSGARRQMLLAGSSLWQIFHLPVDQLPD
jgi:hypothetical protein